MIETEEQYDSAAVRLSELVRKGRRRTADETRLMKLLAVLVGDYDERNALPPAGMAAAEALQYLLEQSGKTVVDLKLVEMKEPINWRGVVDTFRTLLLGPTANHELSSLNCERSAGERGDGALGKRYLHRGRLGFLARAFNSARRKRVAALAVKGP